MNVHVDAVADGLVAYPLRAGAALTTPSPRAARESPSASLGHGVRPPRGGELAGDGARNDTEGG